MNKLKENKLGIIIGIISVIVLIGIIYAVFTEQLTINGTADVRNSSWDIHIVESGQLEPSNTLSQSAKVLTKPVASSTSISDFALSLTTPGDTIEYTFHVINDGDYDAEISDLAKDGVTCTANGITSDPEAVKVCNKLHYTLKYDNGSDVAEGDEIASKEKKTMILTIKYQDFNDSSLLANTNVSISGLGIDIEYRQLGSAKVNRDGTTPYQEPTYEIGEELTYKNESYRVIGDGEDYVTLLKSEPLTYEEMTANHYGQGYINRYTYGNVGQVYNSNGYGGIAYYSSPTCGYPLPGSSGTVSGCSSENATNYNSSDIKHVIDDWVNTNFTKGELTEVNGYRARLIKISELLPYYPSCTLNQLESSWFCSKETGTPSWLYNSNYWYWTMDKAKNSSSDVWIVEYGGGLIYSHVGNDIGAVRPVINVYKSKL